MSKRERIAQLEREVAELKREIEELKARPPSVIYVEKWTTDNDGWQPWPQPAPWEPRIWCSDGITISRWEGELWN